LVKALRAAAPHDVPIEPKPARSAAAPPIGDAEGQPPGQDRAHGPGGAGIERFRGPRRYAILVWIVLLVAAGGGTYLYDHRNDPATLAGHTDTVTAIAFSPDSATLASASEDHTVRIWDVSTRKSLARLTGHTGPVKVIAFSPDGRTLASASEDHTVRIWDVGTRESLATLNSDTGEIRYLEFSPDGAILATTSDKVRLWDVTTTRNTATISESGAVAFGIHGKILYGFDGYHKKLWLWDVKAGQTINVTPLTLPADFDGSLWSFWRDNVVTIWDIRATKQIATLSISTGTIEASCFGPGTTFATANSDGTIRLWNITTEKTTTIFRRDASGVQALAFSPNGKTLASGSSDDLVRLWKVG
jgi:WD40 repeat protein